MKPGSKTFYLVSKPLVFCASLLPLALLMLGAFQIGGQDLGTNPIETLLHELGRWGLKFLLLSLAVTPVRRWTGWGWLIRFRRMLGLFAFFYVSLHFLTYAALDQGWELGLIFEDVLKRPYITLGMLALVLMVPLAVTSTRSMMRRLGKRWASLHRLVYLVSILAVWHFYWQVKLDTLQPLLYALVLLVLLFSRFKKRKP